MVVACLGSKKKGLVHTEMSGVNVGPGNKDSAEKRKLWGRLTNMANATNAFKRALDQSPKDSHVVDFMKLKPEEAQLKMGDAVSLFSIEANGYLISEGCVAAVHY